jgi:hypothetical protein
MFGVRLRPLLTACTALAVAVLAAGTAVASPSSDYNHGLALGTEAYQYGVPLLDTQRVFASTTNVRVCNPITGHGPVNQFCNVRNLVTALERTVNAPNNDTLYSIAWLDLSKQPRVLHAPPIKNRFWEFELLDPWTNNFYNITSAHLKLGAGDFGVTGGGNWAVVGPSFKGKLPKGVIRVESKYSRVWIIGRTYTRGPSDLAAVHQIQNGYSIVPLSSFGKPHVPPPAKPTGGSGAATIPGTLPGENPLDFYAALGKEMLQFPAPAADQPLLAQLRAIDVGPGLDPEHDATLSTALRNGMDAAVRQGQSKVLSAFLALYLKEFAKHNGYFIRDLGDWGTDYLARAIGDRIGLGGQRASIATYPFALFDDTKALLTGSKRYVLHIARGDLPPVKAFWSLTMYNDNSFFVVNPLRRYLINSLSQLHANSDGSIDIYIQHNSPTNPKQVGNWLPAPAAGAGFRLILRLYDLGNATEGVLDGSGWQPPAIQPCNSATNVGSLGTACAS